MPLRESDNDTIVAISTPAGEGGLGVVRLSGKEAVSIADRIFKAKNKKSASSQKSFTARYGRAICPESGRTIDEAILLLMRGPKSYTREDVAEISAHGGQAALQGIVGAALKAGARLAAEGEFTKRAFLSGRIDLLQAEAVLDLIRAKTDVNRRWAASQLEGSLSEKMKSIKSALVGVLSHLEAEIDFPDDAPDTADRSTLSGRLAAAKKEIENLLAGSALGFIAKRGFLAVLAGKPNVGKSSLMNRLAGANRVIVTPYAGTTRDVVEEEIEIRGFPLRLQDTAGIQPTSHPIEKEGIERSKKAIEAADLVLCVLDGSQVLDAEDKAVLAAASTKPHLVVANKSDLPKKVASADVFISCVNDQGFRELEEKIFTLMTKGRLEIPSEAVISTARQKDLLEKTLGAVGEAEKACRDGLSGELVAVDIRAALEQLGRIVGETVTDDVLDALFSQFCIGK
jgi:tRNA modification GTPase